MESHYTSSTTPIPRSCAYKIDGAFLVYQTDYICALAPGYGVGTVGISTAESEYGNFLFVTFETLSFGAGHSVIEDVVQGAGFASRPIKRILPV